MYLEGVPDSVLQDRISVTNPARAPLTVRLRGDGRAGPWLRFAEETVTVPARTRADVPFALALPGNATPGDLAGEIVATAGGGAERRVPVRVRVGGPALAALTVEDVEVSGGTVRYALVNRGNTPLRPRLAVRADGVFGVLLDRPERPLPLELAPGRRVELTEPWPDAPALDSVTVRLRVTAEGGRGARRWPRRRTSRWRRSPGRAAGARRAGGARHGGVPTAPHPTRASSPHSAPGHPGSRLGY